MSRELYKMNLISAVQQLPDEDIELVQNYVEMIERENEELKKQLNKANDELYTLKNKYNIRLLNQISENIEPDCEDYYLVEIETKANKYDLIQNQQQEFIKYLEDEKDRLARECSNIYENSLGRTKFVNEDIFDEVDKNLQKYKEIIGGNKDEY